MSERICKAAVYEIGGYDIEIRVYSDCPENVLDGLLRAVGMMFEASKRKEIK